MAATGFTPISLYYSTTAAAVPTAGNLVPGELAINIADGKLYYENSSGVVTLLAAASGASGDVVGPASATDNAIARFDGTTGKIIQNSAVTIADTTGDITTAGYLITAAGAVGTPALTTTGDTNTGIFFPAADTIAFTEGGVESMRIDSSGRLLIGSTSTVGNANANNLEITNPAGSGVCGLTFNVNSGSASTGSIYWRSNASNNAIQLVGDPISNYFAIATSGAERMRITSDGLVCVNGTSGTALVTIAASNTFPALKVPNIVEAASIVAGAPASTQTFYLGSGAVQYYTSNAANNWTVNFAMAAGTSLNTAMAVGDSMSCTMLTTQSATAYYNTTVQIDGTTSGVTTKWQGSAPTSGNASSIDVYTYVIIKTASATYTVLASQTKFA